MDDVKLANYFAGTELGPIEAGKIDQQVSTALGLTGPTIVWLSDWTITKIYYRHPKITFQDYLRIPEVFAGGFVVYSSKLVGFGRRARNIEIFHLNDTLVTLRMWRVCLKATASDQVFITTFHHTNLKEMRRMYARGQRRQTLIRPAENRLAQRLVRCAS